MTETATHTLESLGTFQAEDIQGELEHLAADFGAQCDRLIVCTRNLMKAKEALSEIEARLDLQIRKKMEITGEKFTEKKIRSAIETTGEWAAARHEVNVTEEQVETCKLAMKVYDKKERAMELIARFQIKEFGTINRTQ